MSEQGTHVLAQGLKDEARKLKDVIISSNIVPSLKLDGEELGYVKQLKELHRDHSVLLEEHRQLQESKEGVVKQLHTAREVWSDSAFFSILLFLLSVFSGVFFLGAILLAKFTGPDWPVRGSSFIKHGIRCCW